MAGLAFGLLAATAAATADRDLAELRARLERLQGELNETRASRDQVRTALQQQEQRIGALTQRLRTTDQRLTAEQRRLTTVRREACATRRTLDRERAQLEQELRAAYVMGRQDTLKLLLSQEDPARAARLLAYQRLMARARLDHMQALRTSMSRFKDLEQDLDTRSRALTALHTEQAEQMHTLDSERRSRAVTLASLNREVRTRAGEIERLRADQKRLERLLGELRTVAPTLPPLEPGAGFASLKGRLPAPTRGQLAARFGESRQMGDLRWRGIFLATREGEPVYAVARGRVVYADWLKGFGLLLILDHGDGYMTLYGHNQSLARAVGDPVDMGGAIATAGNTGDAPRSGVYFELRRHGEPTDPLPWLALGGRDAQVRRR